MAGSKKGSMCDVSVKSASSGVKMKKELSLMDGVGIIVGIIIGAGIFVSPRGVISYSGSVGASVLIWIASGVLSMIGALCYAELGTMIPKSGGDYAYISEAFGPLPAFLFLWVALFILVPTGNAITAITFAQNILQPIWGSSCDVPVAAVVLLAAATTCLLTIINCYNVKLVTRVQDFFAVTKLFAVVIIVVAGIYYLCIGHREHFVQPMEGTNWAPGNIALAFYSGLFSYSGWNYLNFVTEELKDPYKNLPKAICISMPIVTIVYVITNIAYFVVLSKDEIITSGAVAVTFGDKVLGSFSFVMPFFVACATFGSLNGAIFASSRLFFVGARSGHLPRAIALIDVKRFTPVPSLVFMCLITLVLIVVKDIDVLIILVSFAEALFILISICGLLYMRKTKAHLNRPIKVNLMYPIIFLVNCTFLICCSFVDKPVVIASGVALILLGIPVYLVTIQWKNKPIWMLKCFNSFNNGCSKLFMCVVAEDESFYQ